LPAIAAIGRRHNDFAELATDRRPLRIELGGKRGPARMSHRPGKTQPCDIVPGQLVCLLVGKHLQAILHPSQVTVGREQLLDSLGRQQLLAG